MDLSPGTETVPLRGWLELALSFGTCGFPLLILASDQRFWAQSSV